MGQVWGTPTNTRDDNTGCDGATFTFVGIFYPCEWYYLHPQNKTPLEQTTETHSVAMTTEVR